MEHSVRFFLQLCDHCRTIFPLPLLSDFAYGEFIFHSQAGKYHVYSNVFEDPAWDICAMVLAHNTLTKQSLWQRSANSCCWMKIQDSNA